MNNDIYNIVDKICELKKEDFDKLDEKEIIDLYKKINPYGLTIEGSKDYLNVCVTNVREEYVKKLLTTSLIGFLFRACDEWEVPDNIPVTPVEAYLNDEKVLDSYELSDDKFIQMENNFNKDWMKKRVIVREFLEHVFKFNPDYHVRCTYLPNEKDPEREVIFTDVAKQSVNHYFKKNKKLQKEYGSIYKNIYSKEHENKAREEVKLDENIEQYKNKELIDKKVENRAYNIIPPDDMFYNFNKYYNANYETLIKITKNIYNDKPDISLLINPLKSHTTKEDAELYKRKHAKDMIADILTLKFGTWNLLGPYSQNKERVQFYDDHNGILEEILKQNEKDTKLSKKIVENSIIKKKKESIRRYGPDDKDLNKYKSSFGKKSTMDIDKEISDINKDDENDLIEVNVYKLSKGGTKLKQDVIYSKSIPPLHMLSDRDREKYMNKESADSYEEKKNNDN